MKYIIKSDKNLGALTNRINALPHSHWLLQLFLSSEDNLEIAVMDQKISCKCIVVDINKKHSFNTGNIIHFTMLIKPTSKLAIQIRKKYINGNGYYVVPEQIAAKLQIELRKTVLATGERLNFEIFLRKVYEIFQDGEEPVYFDNRISTVIELIDTCECGEETHRLGYYAKELSLSESRLAHLFKEQTGIPLKSYIVMHKLERAYKALMNGSNITTAAMDAGFDSTSHLAYTNKKMTGMSISAITKDSEFLIVSL